VALQTAGSSAEQAFGGGALARWVLAKAGLEAAHYRVRPLSRRSAACLRALRVPSEEAARTLLERQPALLDTALDSLLLGVTEFFRDPPVFEVLRGRLPALAASTAGSRSLRIWSLSCSIGCELYSIGILLAEAGLLAGTDLLGTDCRKQPLVQAREGLYPQTLVAAIEPGLRARHFDAAGDCRRVREPLRSQVQWRQEDLFARDTAAEEWDMIFWRNTAIYLDPAAASSVWSRLARALRPGGLLVTGKAERPGPVGHLRRVAASVYIKAEADPDDCCRALEPAGRGATTMEPAE